MSWPVEGRWGCTLRGQCELSNYGDYSSLEECESKCESSEAVDLIYLILSYDWDKAFTATVTDQQELLRREFGLRVSGDEVVKIVGYLANRDISGLLHYSPVFAEYLEESLTSFELLLLEASEIIAPIPYLDWKSYEKQARRLLTKELNNYISNNFGLDTLAQNLAIVITFSLSMSYYSIASFDQLQALIDGWLPELFRELAPEKYEELYQ